MTLFFRRPTHDILTTIYNTESPHLHYNHNIQYLIPTFFWTRHHNCALSTTQCHNAADAGLSKA